jgi:hypothetical protein
MRTKSIMSIWASTLGCLCLTGCDDLSTGVISKSPHGAMFRWHDKGEPKWSVAFTMPVDRPQTLLRAPFRNMSDLGVKDGERWLHVDPQNMVRLHDVCDPGPECIITYLGDGKLRVTRTAGS